MSFIVYSLIWNVSCGRWNSTRKTRRRSHINSMKYSCRILCVKLVWWRVIVISSITIGSHDSSSNFKTWRIEWKIWYRLTCPWRCRNSNGGRIVARRSVTSARNHSHRSTHGSVIIAILPYNFVIKEIVTAYDGRVDVLTKEKYILFMKNFKISQKNLEIASNYDLSIRTSSLVLV